MRDDVERERAAIVEWLEAMASERGKKTQDGWALHWAAYVIERGDHLKDTNQLSQGEG